MSARRLILSFALVLAACSSGGESSPAPEPTPQSASASATTPSPATTAPAPPTTEDAPATTSAVTTAPVTTSPPSQPAVDTTPPADTTPPTDTTPPAGVPALTEAERADQELARTALITLDSFPQGWVEAPVDDDESGDDDEFEAQFDACLGRDDAERVGDDLERLTVSTGDFGPVDDETTSVSHEVVLAPDADTAITAMSEVSVEGAEECIADVVQRFYQTTFADDPELDGITIGAVTVTRTERERPPDLAIGVLLEIPLTFDEQTVSQYLEVLYQRQGRALSELSFTSFGAPFSRDGYTILSDEAVIGLAPIGS